MVYDRMSNTPANAVLSEPKRVIAGLDTKVEFNCGLYVDPRTGDIYSINNDTIDTMVVFSRNAKGNVRPNRELSTPHRAYGIAVDEHSQELFLTIQDPPMVVVHHKDAKGEAEPIRVLRGNKTGLRDAHGIGLDTKNGLMFVGRFCRYTVESCRLALRGGKLPRPRWVGRSSLRLHTRSLCA